MSAFRIEQITTRLTGEVWALVRTQEVSAGEVYRIYPFPTPTAAYKHAVDRGIPVYDPDWA